MSNGLNKAWLWTVVALCVILVALSWTGYKAVGYQLLLEQLPLCS